MTDKLAKQDDILIGPNFFQASAEIDGVAHNDEQTCNLISSPFYYDAGVNGQATGHFILDDGDLWVPPGVYLLKSYLSVGGSPPGDSYAELGIRLYAAGEGSSSYDAHDSAQHDGAGVASKILLVPSLSGQYCRFVPTFRQLLGVTKDCNLVFQVTVLSASADVPDWVEP